MTKSRETETANQSTKSPIQPISSGELDWNDEPSEETKKRIKALDDHLILSAIKSTDYALR